MALESSWPPVPPCLGGSTSSPRHKALTLRFGERQHLQRCPAAGDLVHGALFRRLVGAPAEEAGAVAEAAAGEVVVFDFDDQFRSERFPFAGAFGAPAARAAGRLAGEA